MSKLVTLTPRERQVINLRVIDGNSQGAVAKKLGCHIDTVQNNERSAIAKLIMYVSHEDKAVASALSEQDWVIGRATYTRAFGILKKGEPANSIRRMLGEGYNQNQIVKALKVAQSTVSHHRKMMGMGNAPLRKYDWTVIDADLRETRSLKITMKKWGFSYEAYKSAARRGEITLWKSMCSYSLDELLAFLSGKRAIPSHRRLLRKAMVASGTPNRCACCKRSKWRGHPLALDLDHVDGDPWNNTIENLRLLCPNCHSITATWRGRNVKARSKRCAALDIHPIQERP